LPKVSFNCAIKEINNKLLVSCDQSSRILLEKDNLSLEVKNALNELQDHELNKSQELRITIEI